MHFFQYVGIGFSVTHSYKLFDLFFPSAVFQEKITCILSTNESLENKNDFSTGVVLFLKNGSYHNSKFTLDREQNPDVITKITYLEISCLANRHLKQ